MEQKKRGPMEQKKIFSQRYQRNSKPPRIFLPAWSLNCSNHRVTRYHPLRTVFKWPPFFFDLVNNVTILRD